MEAVVRVVTLSGTRTHANSNVAKGMVMAPLLNREWKSMPFKYCNGRFVPNMDWRLKDSKRCVMWIY